MRLIRATRALWGEHPAHVDTASIIVTDTRVRCHIRFFDLDLDIGPYEPLYCPVLRESLRTTLWNIGIPLGHCFPGSSKRGV